MILTFGHLSLGPYSHAPRNGGNSRGFALFRFGLRGFRPGAELVHRIAQFAHGGHRLWIRRVADVRPADLEILSVETSGRSLIRELVPMHADDLRIVERRAHIRLHALRAIDLVGRYANARSEGSAVGRAKMELSHHHRCVEIVGKPPLADGLEIDVVADDIARLHARVDHPRLCARSDKTASEIEKLRIERLDRRAGFTEILVHDNARKGIQVWNRSRRRKKYRVEHLAPVGVRRLPSRIEFFDRAVFLAEELHGRLLRRLIGRRLERPLGELARGAAPFDLVVDEKAYAPRIMRFASVLLERGGDALRERFVPRIAEFLPHSVAS